MIYFSRFCILQKYYKQNNYGQTQNKYKYFPQGCFPQVENK